ncbi:NADP-dependent oxidoreductase [Actinophytocola xanthii]|uniref:NADPH:quinone reductase n=1 Tax=Actinophytocola xanthii TaxID=1912961 RepID=A0A1Q8C4D5_9PSEU|nr:NADP-dependent oxidoreductase [Actinophytocola xanthii]OLF09238.1 NADPH:quinone reductase [Actinophytocola xanthii]
MIAARIHRFGAPSVIQYDDVEAVAPEPDEVLVEVAAASFNPSELGLRRGLLQTIAPVSLPYTLGWDLAGTVVEVGTRVSDLAAGHRVVGLVDGGAAAEYATVPAASLVPAPRTVPLPDSATLPLAGLTAWQAVFEHARVRAGQRVLVNGAGGGVGGFAVQLAKHAGAEVVATAGRRSAARLRRFGADQLVDHTAGPLRASVDSPVDTILNLVPLDPPGIDELVALVGPGGTVVSATPVRSATGAEVNAVHFVTRRDTAQLAALVELVDAGAVAVEVTRSYPLTQLDQLHRDCEEGRVHGKVTVCV